MFFLYQYFSVCYYYYYYYYFYYDYCCFPYQMIQQQKLRNLLCLSMAKNKKKLRFFNKAMLLK